MEKAIIRNADDLQNFTEEFIEGNRKGVIQLAAPMLNINEWLGSKPSFYALLLDMSMEQFEKIAYYASPVVRHSTLDIFNAGQILDVEGFAAYEGLPEEDKAKVEIAEGAEAVEFLLKRIDLKQKFTEAREKEIALMQKLEKLWDEYDDIGGSDIFFDLEQRMAAAKEDENGEIYVEMTDEEKKTFALNTDIEAAQTELQIARDILMAVRRINNNGLDALIIREITLFPVELKGILKAVCRDMPYLADDIQLLYRRIVQRNERLRKLTEMGAPDIILRNERRMLQEYVDTLIANGKRGCAFTDDRDDDRCPVTSLSDLLLLSTKLV